MCGKLRMLWMQLAMEAEQVVEERVAEDDIEVIFTL